MRKTLVSGALLLILAAPRQAAPAGEEYETPGPVPEHAQVTLLFDKAEFFLGENVLAHLVLENTGAAPFSVSVGGDNRSVRQTRYIVTATGEDGRPVADPTPDPVCFGGLGGGWDLDPGEKRTFSIPLLRYCRFEKAGVYTVRVKHDFGWEESAKRKIPVAETTVKLVMPTEKEARTIFHQTFAMPEPGGGVEGEKGEPFADFSTLRFAPFLAPLTELADSGNPRALEGIENIPTPEATRALILLLDHKDTDFAFKAAESLTLRLPEPELEGKLPDLRLSVRFTQNRDQRKWLAENSWRPDFAPAVRGKARLLMADDQPDRIGCGAFMIHCVGEKEDLPDLVRALDRAVPRTAKGEKEFETETLSDRPRGVCERLLGAAAMLALRGGEPVSDPKTPGEIAFFLQTLGVRKDFRPKGWEERLASLSRHETPFVREMVPGNLAVPVPKNLVKVVASLLQDHDPHVLIAACGIAEKSKISELREPALRVLATTKESRIAAGADRAAEAMGAGFEAAQIFASRIGEEGMQEALDHLTAKVVDPTSYTTRYAGAAPDPAKAPALKKAWTTFLETHREEIRSGRKLKIGEPGLKADLFPRSGMFLREGLPPWP